MKIEFGRESHKSIASLRKAITEDFLQRVAQDVTISIPRKGLQSLETRIERMVVSEMKLMARFAEAIIESSRAWEGRVLKDDSRARSFEFGPERFMTNGPRGKDIPGLRDTNPKGKVSWKALSKRQLDAKKRHSGGQPSNRFFDHRGPLRAFIRTQAGERIVEALGAPEIDTSTIAQQPGRRRIVTTRFAFGQVKIRLFPRAAPDMFLMLSRASWHIRSPTGSIEFNNDVFGGQMAKKLSGLAPRPGYKGAHRQLFAPLASFWLAYRLPIAVNRAMRAWSLSSRGGQAQRYTS